MKIGRKKLLSVKQFLFLKRVKLKKGVVVNDSSAKAKIIFRRVLKTDKPYLVVDFCGESSYGVEARLISLDRKWLSEPIELNSETLIKLESGLKTRRFLLYINVPANTKLTLKKLTIKAIEQYSLLRNDDFKNDTLVITPMYPSTNKPYSATFVYSKVQKYLEKGVEVDVAVVTDYEDKLYKYKYQGMDVNKVSFDDLRNIIQRGSYKKILVHFFDRQICNALSACDLDDTEVFIYCHGADVDLWNQNIFGKYFEAGHVFTQNEIDFRNDRLEAMKSFESRENVKWIFNTKWNYLNSQKVTGLKFKNHAIIPCIIDENEFKYAKRTSEQSKRILVLKKMDDVRQYAVDLAVRIIMKLSEEDFFDELTFTVAGSGDFQYELTHPLRKFSNVNIVDRFFEHSAINQVFLENGILLAPSRYDTQGVTVGEAAMSGMVVVASSGTGVSDMLPEKLGTFFDNDRIDDAVKIIKDLVKGEKKIEDLSEKFHKAILSSASPAKIDTEISLLKSTNKKSDRLKSKGVISKKRNPVLTIAIPAYNAAQYLKNTIKSMVNQKNLHLLEIIVVNDGSKDNTVGVMKEILKEASAEVRKAIVFIDKENGGHGSTINAALKIAKGKYFRVVDADDRLDSGNLEKHLDVLSHTDVDIVFTNTIHDLSVKSVYRPDHKYDFMVPYQTYQFDELCEEYYGFEGYGPVLSTSSVKTENLRRVGCKLTEKSFYVDIEYNYFMTEASSTAMLDPVDLYYYYLGREGQSLSTESYKRNFYQHLNVMESVIKLLEKNKLTAAQYEHFVRVQLHETIAHQYRIAVEMFNSYTKYKQVEKVLKRYPRYYKNNYLIPGYVKRLRKFGYPYFAMRRVRSILSSIKHFAG